MHTPQQNAPSLDGIGRRQTERQALDAAISAVAPLVATHTGTLVEALQAIIIETMQHPPRRPYSADSYLPAHLIAQAQQALAAWDQQVASC